MSTDLPDTSPPSVATTSRSLEQESDLTAAGYQPELRRGVGELTAFASSFALISIVVGFLSVYGIGYAFAGPAVVWTIPIVFVGQLLVALVFAELAARFPFAGSIYQWSHRLGGRVWGAHIAWIYIAAWILALPSGIVGLQLTLTAISPRFQFVGDHVPGVFDKSFAQNAIILALVVFAVTTVVNLLGVRAVAIAGGIGLIAELAGLALLIVVLAGHVHHGIHASFDTLPHGNRSYVGLFLIGAFLPMYQFFGFDQATSLAEETRDPRRQGPRALLRSYCVAGLLAFVVAILIAVSIPDRTDPGIVAGGVPYLLNLLGGTGVGQAFLWLAAICFLAAGIAGHSLIARMIFSSARDHAIVGSTVLSRVSPRTKVPVAAVLVPTGLWAMLLLLNLGNARIFEAIIGGAVVLIYVAYLGVTLPALIGRLRGTWRREPAHFGLPRRTGTVVATLAVLWGLIGLINLLIPRSDFYGPSWYQQYSSLIILGLAVLTAVVQTTVLRRRPADDTTATRRPGPPPS